MHETNQHLGETKLQAPTAGQQQQQTTTRALLPVPTAPQHRLPSNLIKFAFLELDSLRKILFLGSSSSNCFNYGIFLTSLLFLAERQCKGEEN